MKKNLPSISAILYKSKKLANGEHPIMLRVCYNGQRKYKAMGLSCLPKDWNEKKEEVRALHPQAVDTNTIIRKEKRNAEDVVLTLEKSGLVYSVNSIINALAKEAPSTKTLFSLFDERIEFFKEVSQQFNTATGYTTLLNVIKRYTNNADIELFEISVGWVRDFEAHLRTKYKDTSIRKFFDCFRAIMNYAVDKNYIEKSPLCNYTFIRKLDKRTKKRALSLPEITKLIRYYYDTYGIYGDKKPNVEVNKRHYWNKSFRRRGTTKLTAIDAEQLSLALYLSSYCLQGLALVDLAKLKWRDIQDYSIIDKVKYSQDLVMYGVDYAEANKKYEDYYKIEIARTKTGQPVRIIVKQLILLPYLLPFMENIKGMSEEEQDEQYVFPIFANIDDTANKKFGRMTYATYLVNVNLKRVAEKLGIHGITFYSARHSYASNLYHSNVPTGLIAQNMGRNPADIETYLKEFDYENIIKANEFAFITGQPEYKEAKSKKPINLKRREFFENKEKEEMKLLEQFGGIDGYNEHIRKEREKLRVELTEMFGDDNSAKIEYLKNNSK
jgi:integrase